jgi:hypothetical protein
MIRKCACVALSFAAVSTARADDNVIWRAARGRSAGAQTVSGAATPLANLAADPPAAEAKAIPQGGDAPKPTPVLPAPTPVEGAGPAFGGPVYSSDSDPAVTIGMPTACGGNVSWKAATVEQRAPRVEATAEYLLWWSKAQSAGPLLLSTSPPNGANGVPGAVPGAIPLLRAGDLGNNFRDGVRFGVTYWLDDCASYGFEGRIFFTGDRSDQFRTSSAQFPNGLYRPFIAANPGLPGPFSELVTAPGVTAGTFTASNTSNFWGAEVNYRDNIWQSCDCDNRWRVDLLAGFRYLHLDESLTVNENYTLLSPATSTNITSAGPVVVTEPAGTHVVITDSFATHNDFYGGQIGTTVGYRNDRWTVDLRATVALGTNHERLDIAGGQMRTPPGGAPQFFQGGLLALPTNSGQFTRDVFAVAPEVGLTFGYQVTDHVRAFVGYNFLYLSNVIRPNDQIDPVLDVNFIPRFLPTVGNPPMPVTIPSVFPPRPEARLNETDFWAQGVNFGVEFRW